MEQFPLMKDTGKGYVQVEWSEFKELIPTIPRSAIEDMNKKLDDYYRYYLRMCTNTVNWRNIGCLEGCVSNLPRNIYRSSTSRT